MKKKISPQVIMSLEKALSLIYWYKNDLKDYLYASLERQEILYVINWNDTKRNIVARVIHMLVKNENITQECLLQIIHDVSTFNDFSHLAKLDDGDIKVKEAKHAVGILRNMTSPFFLNKEEDEIYKERSRKAKDEYSRINREKESLESLKQSFITIVRYKIICYKHFRQPDRSLYQ